MSTASPGNPGLARRLVALEAARGDPAGGPGGAVARVCDEFRTPLAKLAGQAGFHSLLSRALALAKAANPALAPVQVRADGTLGGHDGVLAAHGTVESGADIVAHLLGLLETFIGVTLTMRLVYDIWPELSGVEKGRGSP